MHKSTTKWSLGREDLRSLTVAKQQPYRCTKALTVIISANLKDENHNNETLCL